MYPTHKLSRILITLLITTLLSVAIPVSADRVLAAPLMAGSDDFIITVQTDNAGTSSSTQFTIPTTGTGYNYNVDCDSDGTDEITGHDGDYTCDYGTGKEGTYTITIEDNSGAGTGFPRIYFNDGGDKLQVLTIENWGTGKWTSMSYAFSGCSNLTSTATDTPDLSLVTDLSSMFRNASSFNADITGWNTGNVTSMYYMFYNAAVFDQEIGSWNTSNVVLMTGMFRGAAAFNGNIGAWDTSAVTQMNLMFTGASVFNQDISLWNTANVDTMRWMFVDASAFNQDIGGWNTAAVTDMSSMFGGAVNFNQDIGGWNTAAVTDMGFMFNYASTFNQDLGSWNTGAVTDMYRMFANTAFDQDIGSWDIGSLTTANSMFTSVTLSTANYDALLTGWNAQTPQSAVDFGGGSSKYCYSETDRANLITSNSWTITDGGRGCPAPSILFTDGFETGDFSLWSRFNDGNGYLYACTDAAINGTYGACVDRGTNKRKQLIDETPINKTEYSVRFNFDINSLSMGVGERFRFMQVKMGANRPFFIVLKYQGGSYKIQLNTLLDDLTKVKSGWYPLSNAPHTIEVAWSAAAGDGTNDGFAMFYLDDSALEYLGSLDNDTIYVDTFKIGFTSRLTGKSISGIFYLDDVATSNGGYISPP